MLDPFDHLADIDPEARHRAVPLSGRPFLRLLFGDWRSGSIGQSEYFQAWILIWLGLGPILLLIAILYLAGALDPMPTVGKAALALIATLFAVVTVNLGAKRARGKGMPGWMGSIAGLAGWVFVPLMHSSAAPLVALTPIAAGAAIDRLAKKRGPQRLD